MKPAQASRRPDIATLDHGRQRRRARVVATFRYADASRSCGSSPARNTLARRYYAARLWLGFTDRAAAPRVLSSESFSRAVEFRARIVAREATREGSSWVATRHVSPVVFLRMSEYLRLAARSIADVPLF